MPCLETELISFSIRIVLQQVSLGWHWTVRCISQYLANTQLIHVISAIYSPKSQYASLYLHWPTIHQYLADTVTDSPPGYSGYMIVSAMVCWHYPHISDTTLTNTSADTYMLQATISVLHSIFWCWLIRRLTVSWHNSGQMNKYWLSIGQHLTKLYQLIHQSNDLSIL